MNWSDKHAKESEAGKLLTERQRNSLHEKVTNITEELDVKTKELGELHRGRLTYRREMEQELNKKTKDLEGRLAAVAKQDAELMAREAKKKRRSDETPAQQNLFEAIEKLEVDTERAVR